MAAKGHARVRTKKVKGKRWKKGQSSSSNPETKRFRSSAKSRFFNQIPDAGGLTQEALAKHDEAQSDAGGDVDSETGSVGGKTFSTWATNWTDCTNTTFSKVHRYWSSNMALHKEIFAVLAAVTEVIKMKSGKETETEYFAALMTTLDTVEGDESLSAVSYLLSLVMKRVPLPVLKSKFSDIGKVLMTHLADHSQTGSSSLLKSLVSCLGTLLKVQDPVAWSDSSSTQIFHGILGFITHSKPKVRKASHSAICSILRGSPFMLSPEAPPYHPATSTAAKYCIQLIEGHGGGPTGGSTSLYILALLKDILGVFPKISLKSTCEAILRLMTLSNVIVNSKSMQALHGMLAMQPKSSSLPPDLNAQIITAMYDYLPGENDIQPTSAWLAVMEKAHINLGRLDAKLCVSHLPRLFTTCMACLLSQKTDVQKAGASTIKALLKQFLEASLDRLQSVLETDNNSPIQKMFKVVESGLGYQYFATWDLVLQILTVFYEVAGRQCHRFMTKSLQTLCDLRDSHDFSYKAELERAFGLAIQTMGPRVVLEAVPLQLTGNGSDYTFPRSWIIPVLRDAVKETELAYFTTYFLPLAAKLRAESVEFAQSNRFVVCKAYDTLSMQIWSLLPGFCTRPTDLKTAFKGIAKILGSALSDRPDLRMDVMLSLRKLILLNAEDEENKSELARFSKNFIPILFNIFSTEPERENDTARLAALETIKVYFQVADNELISSMFDKVEGKISEDGVAPFRQYALLDLCIVMVPYLNTERLQTIYSKLQLDSDDRTIQKKSYRILEEICSNKSPECRDYVQLNLPDFESVLLKSLPSSNPSSKAPRLRCLINIFKQLEEEETPFLQACVPEAILCTKEVNEKARMAAYNLLVEMGEAIARWSEEPADVAMGFYFDLVMAGLAGSPHLVSATVFGLSKLVHQYKESLSSATISALIENLCVLLKSKSREIVQAALTLLKVVLIIFKDVTLAQFLNNIISSLISMKDEGNHHFRFKTKEIFGKLIKKFGYETIHGMVPVSHHKLLINIRKIQECAKKKRREKEDTEVDAEEDLASIRAQPESIEEILRETDSEIEDDDDTRKSKDKRGPRKGSGKAWLKESEGDIVDFMDPGVAKKVVATKPGEPADKQAIKHDFKMATDGRMIITEPEAEKEVKSKKPAEIDELDELFEAIGGPQKKTRKRRIEDLGDDADSIPAKYQAGGSGIHRPIPVAKRKKDIGEDYKSKKASGDIKKKGKPEPYAYVPLDLKSLNKRKRAKVAGQFNSLVKGAKRGAVKGKSKGNWNKGQNKGRQRPT